MLARLSLASILLLALQFVAVLGHETNAERLRRGLSPLRPRQLSRSTPIDLAPRTGPSSSSSDCSVSLEGFMTIRRGDGTFLGWLDESGETYTQSSGSACKYTYPNGLGSTTHIQKKGSSSCLGVYGRSIYNNVVSNIQSLSWSNGHNSFTSCKLFSGVYNSIFAGGFSLSGLFVQSSVFKVDKNSKAVSCSWNQGFSSIDLTPIGCRNGNSLTLQWVKGSVTASSMYAQCPGGIETGITVKFECSC